METNVAIDRENLEGVQFMPSDVLEGSQQNQTRLHNLKRAQVLGNLYRIKVKIRFRDANAILHTTETTVWAVLEDYVILKGNRLIPIRAIESVSF